MTYSTVLCMLVVLQTNNPPAAKAPVPIVLKADRLFDGKADSLAQNGMVIVEGKTIKAVGTNLAVPQGSTVIELGDVTLAPGFIDAHTHLTHERNPDYNQGFVDGMRREIPEQAILSTVYARTNCRGRLHHRA